MRPLSPLLESTGTAVLSPPQSFIYLRSGGLIAGSPAPATCSSRVLFWETVRKPGNLVCMWLVSGRSQSIWKEPETPLTQPKSGFLSTQSIQWGRSSLRCVKRRSSTSSRWGGDSDRQWTLLQTGAALCWTQLVLWSLCPTMGSREVFQKHAISTKQFLWFY